MSLDGLNPVQREAVRQAEGPLLILAGAGSGKARVITHRIAYLVGEKAVPPSRIMALTFTNKAAGEMKERAERLIGGAIQSMWIGTFHSICARILRREGYWIGYERNFAVYDTVDQQAVIKKVMASLELPEDRFPLPVVRARISWAKNTYMEPMAALQGGDFFAQNVAKVYAAYQQALRANNAMDFDDLLINVVDLFQSYNGVLETYRDRFLYLLVDEYQDTNRIQYLLTKLLASKHRNLCVVGDDDQSIYGWRQADIRNILEFEQDYPDARVIRLEQNYRSTKKILEAAGAVVRCNRGRKEKALWTENEEGEPLVLLECPDERQEARAVVEMIQEERTQGRSYGEVAVLYRTNAQSRAIEDRLRSAGIPYVIVGGVRFYERKEIKNILAYLRLIANPKDAVSLRRAIRVPRRGIGETTMERVEAFALEANMDLFEVLGEAERVDGLNKALVERLQRFHALISSFQEKRDTMSIEELAQKVVTETGYGKELQKDGTIEGAARVENVNELFSAMADFSERVEESTLEAFLEEVSLITDVDQWDSSRDAVTLMTVHSAKGLEFPVVFITGLEDGLFPLIRPEDGIHKTGNNLEEERRLFYVGMTRARERVFLSFARTRRRWGSPGAQMASRFLGEIPKHLIEPRRSMGPTRWEQRRWTGSESFYTGARVADQLLKQRTQDVEQVAGQLFTVGSWVIHSRFGRGQIVSKCGSGDQLMFVIVFDTGVKKKVMAKYAHLEPA